MKKKKYIPRTNEKKKTKTNFYQENKCVWKNVSISLHSNGTEAHLDLTFEWLETTDWDQNSEAIAVGTRARTTFFGAIWAGGPYWNFFGADGMVRASVKMGDVLWEFYEKKNDLLS